MKEQDYFGCANLPEWNKLLNLEKNDHLTTVFYENQLRFTRLGIVNGSPIFLRDNVKC